MFNKTILQKFMFYQIIILLLGFGLLFGVFYYMLVQYENYVLSVSDDLLNSKFEQELQSSTEAMVSLLQEIYQTPDLSSDQKLQLARQLVGASRYGKEGYFFAYELGTGVALIQGGNRALEGTSMWDSQDADGEYFIRQLDNAAMKGTMFVRYKFPKPGTTDAYPKLSAAKLVPNANMWVGTGRYIDSIDADRAVINQEIDSITNRTLLSVSGAFALLLVVLLGVVWIIVGRITRPIRQIAGVAQSIAQGDVDQQLTIYQQDEVGQLADAFRQMIAYLQSVAEAAAGIAAGNLTKDVTPRSEKDLLGNTFVQMITNLRQMVRKLTDAAINLNNASAQLSGTSDQAGRASSQISSTIQQVALGASRQTEGINKVMSSVDQMSRAIEGVAMGAQEQASAVARSTEMTGRMADSIQRVAANVAKMEDVRDKVGLSARKVNEMGRRSQQIGAIVQTIDEIAAQTNLLALNAAIEAARAGEHGKGFAVVADEVRKLAERSSSATKEISQLIQGVQAAVAEAVGAMEQASTDVDNQVEQISVVTREMNVSSDELVQVMETVSAVVEENTASTEEMTAGSTEVADVIRSIASVGEENSAAAQEVSAATEEMTAQVEEVAASAQELEDMALLLQSLVSQFVIDEQNQASQPQNGAAPVQNGHGPARVAVGKIS